MTKETERRQAARPDGSEELFRCEHWKCTKLSISVCVQRQTATKTLRGSGGRKVVRYPYCASGECEIGNGHRFRFPDIQGPTTVAGTPWRQRGKRKRKGAGSV